MRKPLTQYLHPHSKEDIDFLKSLKVQKYLPFLPAFFDKIEINIDPKGVVELFCEYSLIADTLSTTLAPVKDKEYCLFPPLVALAKGIYLREAKKKGWQTTWVLTKMTVGGGGRENTIQYQVNVSRIPRQNVRKETIDLIKSYLSEKSVKLDKDIEFWKTTDYRELKKKYIDFKNIYLDLLKRGYITEDVYPNEVSLDFIRSHLVAKLGKAVSIACGHCGKSFLQLQGKRKYCSNSCRVMASRKRKKTD